MINYKIVLVVVALAIGGGVCSTIALNTFAEADREKDRLEQRKAAACEFYKDTPGKPLPWCE